MKRSSRLALYLGRYLPRGYYRVVRLAADHDSDLQDFELQTSTPGLVLRADLRESVFMPIMRTGCIPHQRGLDHVFREVLQEGEFVVDVGANVGYTSILAATIVGVRGKVLAIEPSPRMYRLLTRSIRTFSQIEALRIAASDQQSSAGVLFEVSQGDRSSLLPTQGSIAQDVELTTLDELLRYRPVPKLVKIDVEGFEPQVLRGMAKLASSDIPPLVAFEALSRSALTQCRAFFADFSSYVSTARVGDGYISRDLDDETLSCDYLAIPKWAGVLVNRLWANDA